MLRLFGKKSVRRLTQKQFLTTGNTSQLPNKHPTWNEAATMFLEKPAISGFFTRVPTALRGTSIAPASFTRNTTWWSLFIESLSIRATSIQTDPFPLHNRITPVKWIGIVYTTLQFPKKIFTLWPRPKQLTKKSTVVNSNSDNSVQTKTINIIKPTHYSPYAPFSLKRQWTLYAAECIASICH